MTRAERAFAAAMEARTTCQEDRYAALYLARMARQALDSARRHAEAERQALIRWGYERDRERARGRRAPGAPEDPVWESVEAQVRAELGERARTFLTGSAAAT